MCAIDGRGHALIAVSGGTTPGLFFRTLAKKELDWPKVTVTLADERFVPASSPRSNAALVSENLLQDKAAAANFAGLYRPANSADEAADQADNDLKALAWPADVVILGMGGDGHTASFFPDAEGLDRLLDPSSEKTVLPVSAPSAGEPRLTLTLPRSGERRARRAAYRGKRKTQRARKRAAAWQPVAGARRFRSFPAARGDLLGALKLKCRMAGEAPPSFPGVP